MGSEARGRRLARLGELGEVNRGRSRHRPRYAEHLYGGPYPFIQTGDVKGSGGRITRHSQTYNEAGLAQSRLWPEGTLCITIAANIAETAILTYPACFPDSVVGFIADKSKCDVYFVEYMFRYLRRRIQHEASGSVQDNINLGTLDRLTFLVPLLGEQRAIAGFLKAFDDKIFLGKGMNQALEDAGRTIFKSWFVDFDPFQGMMPDDWKISSIGEVVSVVGGGTPSTAEPAFWNGPYHFATPKDMASLTAPVLLTTERSITEEGLTHISSGLLPPGTVLLSSRAPIGYLAISEIPVAVNQGFIAMVCDDQLPNFYVIEWARHNMDVIIGHANGTTFLEINKRNFRPIPILVPSRQVLSRFVNLVEPLYRQIAANLKEAKTLAALRDTLLPKLLSGEIRVKQAEKIVSEAV